MKKESLLHSSLKSTRRIKENEVHHIEGSPLLKAQREGMIENHHTMNVTIVTRKVILIEISLRRTKVHATRVEAKVIVLMIKEEEMTKEMTTMEEMKEEEDMLQRSKNKR